MKKNFKMYALCWAIMLALFNVICFVTPNEVAGLSKFGGAFWAGYIFITIAFIGQLVCAYIAFKAENSQKLFYNLPLITVSYTGLILTIIFGSICMAIPNLPNWVGIIVCLLILAFNAIAVIKASASADIVAKVDEKIKTKTEFIKMLTVDAECLANSAKDDEAKKLCKKVYEAIRYSDPMSGVALAETEAEIEKYFKVFKEKIYGENITEADEISSLLLSAIDVRNKKCKLLK